MRNSQELSITSYKSIRTQANSFKDLLAIMLRIIFCKTLKVGKNIINKEERLELHTQRKESI